MLINHVLEQSLRDLGAKRVQVTPDGVATHWQSLREAQAAKENFDLVSMMQFGRLPERIEIFRDNGLFACFVKWPVSPVAAEVTRRN